MGLILAIVRATFDFIKGGCRATITLNFWSILAVVAILIISSYLIIRYRFMTIYSRLPDGDLREADDNGSSYLFEPRLFFESDAEKEHEVMDLDGAMLSALSILGHVEKHIFNKLYLQSNIMEFQPCSEIPTSLIMNNILIPISGKIEVYLEPVISANYKMLDASSIEKLHKQRIYGSDVNKANSFLCEIGPGQLSESIMMISKLFSDNVELPLPDTCHCKVYYNIKDCGCRNSQNMNLGTPKSQTQDDDLSYSYYEKSLQWRMSGVSYAGTKISVRASSKTSFTALKTSDIRHLPNIHYNSTIRFIHSTIDRFRRLIYPVIYKYFCFHNELFELDRRITRTLGYLTVEDGLVSNHELKYLRIILKKSPSPSECSGADDVAVFGPFSKYRKTCKSPDKFEKIKPFLDKHNLTSLHVSHSTPIDTPVTMSDDCTEGRGVPASKNSNIESKVNTTFINHKNDLITHEPYEKLPSERSCTFLQKIKRRIYEKISSYIGADSSFNEKTLSDHRSNLFSPGSNHESVELLYFASGTHIVRQDEKDVGLYLVLDGLVEVFMQSEKTPDDAPRYVNYQSDDIQEDKENLSDSGASVQTSACATETYPMRAYQAKVGNSDGEGGCKCDNCITHNDLSSYVVCSGGILCYLPSISGIPSTSTYTSKTDTIIAKITKSHLSHMLHKYPKMISYFMKRFAPQMSSFMCHADVCIKWKRVPMGHSIWREGEKLHGIYIVTYGRLRSITENKSCKDLRGKYSVQSEYGQGSSVGEDELVNNVTTCPFTLYAVRDSEVAFIPKKFMNSVIVKDTGVMARIATIALRNKGKEKIEEFAPESTNFNFYSSSTNPIRGSTEYKTFALIPLDTTVPINDFASELKTALINVGATVALINQESFFKSLGVYSFRRYGRHKYNSYFENQEESNRVTLYVADSGTKSFWATQCIKRADIIFLVANINGDPVISEYERLLIEMKMATRKELVLLHSDRACSPGSVTRWLRKRGWIQAHHYVHMHNPIMKNFNGLDYLDSLYPKKNIDYHSVFRRHSKGEHIITTYSGIRSDFSRLARRMTSSSIGLILGGGGARGIAHVGILKAFEERGIPIDMVGGCSIGSFVGALYACENNIYRVYSRTKMFSARMSTIWRKAMDITYPYLSLFTGHEFNRGIWKCFKNMLIEECWLPYFCVTSNLTNNKLEVHQTGYLWKYVRASMTVIGYLPPICDKGNMLADGGYMNNIPCDIMKFLGAKTIIAIDVSPLVPIDSVNYGDSISGWWLLLIRIIPGLYRKVLEKYGYVPSLGEIQTRLSFITNVRHVENLRRSELYAIMTPPVDKYEILEFDKFHELYRLGYEYGKQTLKKWEDESLLEKLFGITDCDDIKKTRKVKSRRASI